MSATRLEELDLPFFDDTEPGLVGETFHQRLAQVRDQGWLARSPLAYVVLDRDSGEFFLRAKQTAFPGREIADLFGITTGRLREMIDNNILNLSGARHRRLRALVGPAFSPRAAARWRPRMRGFLDDLWRALAGKHTCEFVAAFAKPYPSLTIAAVLALPARTQHGCTSGPAGYSASSTSPPCPASRSTSKKRSPSFTTTWKTCSNTGGTSHHTTS